MNHTVDSVSASLRPQHEPIRYILPSAIAPFPFRARPIACQAHRDPSLLSAVTRTDHAPNNPNTASQTLLMRNLLRRSSVLDEDVLAILEQFVFRFTCASKLLLTPPSDLIQREDT